MKYIVYEVGKGPVMAVFNTYEMAQTAAALLNAKKLPKSKTAEHVKLFEVREYEE